MLLSDAILLGATLRPQAFGRMFGEVGSCALGAAMEASGHKHGPLSPEWLWGDVPAFICPVMAGECAEMHARLGMRTRVFNIITHLNDYHRWTREQIAEWVRTVEPAEAVPVENAVEEKTKEVETCCV